MRQRVVLCLALVLMVVAAGLAGSQPRALYTTHFFDWYRVTPQQPYESHQRVFTHRPLWERYGIQPQEVGNTENYYARQFAMIRRTGFDGIHYEWYGVQPSDACLAALRAAKMPVAMFYDQEIRFNQNPTYLQPTDAYLKAVIDDVGSFYDRIPRDLWLRESNYTLPIIFYAYRFDTSFTSVEAWDGFYRRLLAGLTRRLSAPVHLYWTDSGAMPQAYAFQHFPNISSYTFGWWGGQRQIGAKAVTLVASYDDAGAVVGGRAARSIANDPQFLEENLTLARVSAPRLVFNYGWNEYYEGENIFPDRTWGDWRLQAISAMVKRLKAEAQWSDSKRGGALPPALILADDLYPASLRHPDAFYDSESALLGAFRYLFPQAEDAIGSEADGRRLAGKRLVLALDRDRSAAQEARLLSLARSGKTKVVAYALQPQQTGGILAQFTAGEVKPALAGAPLPPANQWIGVFRSLDLDPARLPFFRIRARNSPNTFYHVRFTGVDADGKSYANHDYQSPLDWQATGGKWVERRENAKAILESFAGKPIVRITGLTLILNAQGISGDYRAEFAAAVFTDAWGQEQHPVDLVAPGWQRMASFENDPAGRMAVGRHETRTEARGMLRLSLRARLPSDFPVDATTLAFTPRPGVQTLAWTQWNGRRVVLAARRGNIYWVNTMSPTPEVYRVLLPALGMPPLRITVHTQFSIVNGNATVNRLRFPTSLARAPLPLNRIRMTHPSGLHVPVRYPCPAAGEPLAALRTRQGRTQPVAFRMRVTPDGAWDSPEPVTLQPGDTLDLYRLPLRIKPAGRTPVAIETRPDSADKGVILLRGSGQVEIWTTAPAARLTRQGRPAPRRLLLPCRLRYQTTGDGEKR